MDDFRNSVEHYQEVLESEEADRGADQESHDRSYVRDTETAFQCALLAGLENIAESLKQIARSGGPTMFRP